MRSHCCRENRNVGMAPKTVMCNNLIHKIKRLEKRCKSKKTIHYYIRHVILTVLASNICSLPGF